MTLGIAGLFVEARPDPANALCDGEDTRKPGPHLSMTDRGCSKPSMSKVNNATLDRSSFVEVVACADAMVSIRDH